MSIKRIRRIKNTKKILKLCGIWKITKMVKITITKGGKSKKDMIIEVNGVPIGYEEVSRQILRLRDERGEAKVRRILNIPSFKHRKHKIPPLKLGEMKKILSRLYKNEERVYPRSKGYQGNDMLKQKLSRDLFRTRKKINNS